MKIIDSVLLWYAYIRFEILQSPVPVLILSLKFEHLTLPYAFIFLLLFTLYPLINCIQFCSGLFGHNNFIISNFSCFYIFFQNSSLYILENFKRINYLFTFFSLFTIFIILLYFYYLFIVHYQSSLKFFYFCKQFFC